MAPPACVEVLRRIAALKITALALCFALGLPAAAGATEHLSCVPGNLPFGKVVVGQRKTLSASLSNSGSAAIKVESLELGNHTFTVSGLTFPLVLKAHAGVEFRVVFSPESTEPERADLLFNLSSGGSLTVPTFGRGINNWALSASPSSLAFGNVAIGSSSTLSLTLTNQGASTIIIAQESRPSAEFKISGPSLPITLEQGQGAAFRITFTPRWRGDVASDFSVTDATDPTFTVPLAGSGGGPTSAQLTLSPADLSFGSVTVGDTGTQQASITARGGSVTITGASVGSSVFSLSGINLPLTLSQGQSATFDVVFAPQTGGTANSTLKFVSTAGDSPTAEGLSGSGVAQTYIVNLSWDPSTSQVAGYNIYRSASASGTYTKLNSALDPNTAFSDGTVASGVTYYYDVRSVTSSGVESSPCSPLKVTVN